MRWGHAELISHNFPASMPAGCARVAYVRIRNMGSRTWRRDSLRGRALRLVLKVNRTPTVSCALADSEIEPGAETTFSFWWRSPARPGKVRVELQLADRILAPFMFRSRSLLCTEIDVMPARRTRSEMLLDTAHRHNSWFCLPSGGVYWSASGGQYPLFVAEASGSRFRDVDHCEYIDYVSGWGACLLGYAEPRIAAAVADSIRSTSITGLPNSLEIELTEALCDRFSGAEMALFGKNGSDVCTAAVRLARIVTGRPVVLQCGYHGWQDWSKETIGFDQTGIPERSRPVVRAFPYGDLEAVQALFAQHDGQIGAVMIEPAAQVEGVQGPVRDADREFLHAVAALCKREDALLIFDEIFTGFRYRQGSVQNAVDLQPDLTCLGKALSSGMPLSALVGRRDIFEAGMQRISYDATFKGEPHSFAAALKALEIYREEDVDGQVWDYGKRLMAGIDRLCDELDVPARTVGLPIRMTLAFGGDDTEAALMRTFLQQHLLLQGIVCFRGFMLPCYAHTDEDMDRTLKAFRVAFESLQTAVRLGTIHETLEIPLIR